MKLQINILYHMHHIKPILLIYILPAKFAIV